ncbi:hypothetical protein B0H34DRAFT_796336 [Crassisporium funariophilum]|nr:hypothetical protein B0H34DRAFT_796336 [Crassisporium funariophilum]
MPSRLVLLLSLCIASVLAQNQNYTGTLFIFTPGLGACGYTNNSQQLVASVPGRVFNSYPGATANPNKNPICHHKLTVSNGVKKVTAAIVDFNNDPTPNNVGLSMPGFEQFGTVDDGVVRGVTWTIV